MKKTRKKTPNKGHFKEGINPNPDNKSKLPLDVKEARQFNKEQLDAAFNRFLFLNVFQLECFVQSKKNTVLDVIVAKVCLLAAESGNENRLQFICDHLIGPREGGGGQAGGISFHTQIVQYIQNLENKNSQPAQRPVALIGKVMKE